MLGGWGVSGFMSFQGISPKVQMEVEFAFFDIAVLPFIHDATITSWSICRSKLRERRHQVSGAWWHKVFWLCHNQIKSWFSLHYPNPGMVDSGWQVNGQRLLYQGETSEKSKITRSQSKGIFCSSLQKSAGLKFWFGWYVGLVLWYINLCRLFNAKSILYKQIVLFLTIQFSISIQFNCKRHFYFKLFSWVKQF